jgi:hypothetical protein
MKILPALLSALSISHGTIAAGDVCATREGKQVIIRTGTSEILRYQAEPGDRPRPEIPIEYTRGGYIQSIFTPSGRRITDDFPENHLHQHGIWSPWTKTEFEGRNPDFWNMGQKTGRVEFVALDRLWNLKNGSAGFTTRHQFVDLSASPPKAALLETWEINVSVSGQTYIIDFTSIQTCAADSALKLPEYHYGGFGFRGHGDWNGAKNCHYLSSTGLTDRAKINTSREKWCWIGGTVDGETCGVTILGHPANFRFPQPIRAHPTEPFFCFAPQQLGPMEITPAKPYIARYRLVVADGDPDPQKAAEAWKIYAGN